MLELLHVSHSCSEIPNLGDTQSSLSALGSSFVEELGNSAAIRWSAPFKAAPSREAFASRLTGIAVVIPTAYSGDCNTIAADQQTICIIV